MDESTPLDFESVVFSCSSSKVKDCVIGAEYQDSRLVEGNLVRESLFSQARTIRYVGPMSFAFHKMGDIGQ